MGGVSALRRRGVRGALAALAIASTLTGVVVALAAHRSPSPARAAADRFLDRYVTLDGRVVRRDQGGDTVSEGQAYGMLITAALGDGDGFARVWNWTRTRLQRPDGTLSWRWQDGRVTGAGPAADADLDAARALLVAAGRFHRPEYRRAALRIGRGILAIETTHAAGKLVLVAGPWARPRAIVDPSYFSPAAFDALGRASHDRRWAALRRSSVRLAWRLGQQGPGLPPDWAQVEPWGIHAIPAPATGAASVYGYDAVRLPVRMAEACEPDARRRAAALWPFLRRADGRVAAVYRLDGSPATPGQSHAAALVGAAGAAHAAGDAGAASRLLDQAAALDRRFPTYYGAAWVALGRIMLTTRWLDKPTCG
jgi:endo-1,4-beta-D-glucanase Y